MALPTGGIRPRDPACVLTSCLYWIRVTAAWQRLRCRKQAQRSSPHCRVIKHVPTTRTHAPHGPLIVAFARSLPTTPASAQAISSEEHAFRVARVAEGLEHPWGLADGEKVVKEEGVLKGVLGRLRDVRTGPDRFRLAAGAGASGGRSRQFCFDRACVDSGRGLVRNLRRRKRPCGFDQTA